MREGQSRSTGKERDTESGLDYFGARYYASNMGRWMSPDWADKPEAVPYSSLDNPQSRNLYGYVGNNPLSKADADGHCFPFCLALAGGGVLAEEAPLAAAGPVGWTVIGVTAVGVLGYAAYEHFHQEAPAPAANAPAAPAPANPADAKPQEPTSSAGGETAGERFKPGDRAADAGRKCVYCGRQTTEEPGKDNSRETDHGQPRSKDGNREPENRNPSCRTCNRQKGNKTPEEFKKSQEKNPDKVPKAFLILPHWRDEERWLPVAA